MSSREAAAGAAAVRAAGVRAAAVRAAAARAAGARAAAARAATVPVILNGPGRVGMNFARLLEEKLSYIEGKTGTRPVLVAVTDIGRSIFSPEGLSLLDVQQWKAGPVTIHPRPEVDDCSNSPGHLQAGQAVLLNESYTGILDRVAEMGRSGMMKPADGPQGITGIVVEATPTNMTTGEPGLSHLIDALDRGFSAITLAKGPLVVAFNRLRTLAWEKGAGLKYSGAVAAALPTVDTATYSMAGTDITEIEGVLNGTTNFILNSMANGRSYGDALGEAQAMGVAEADPTLDVEGFDSAAKLIIIVNTVWGTGIGLSDVERQGITRLSGQEVMEQAAKGTPVRLVARARLEPEGPQGPENAHLTVRPEPVPAGHPFTHLPGTQKAVRFASKEMGDIVVSGGASDVVGAAASALKDVIHLLEEGRTL